MSWQGTAGGEALQIGAARDKQTAADTAAMSGGANTGAATFAFIQVHTGPPVQAPRHFIFLCYFAAE